MVKTYGCILLLLLADCSSTGLGAEEESTPVAKEDPDNDCEDWFLQLFVRLILALIVGFGVSARSVIPTRGYG